MLGCSLAGTRISSFFQVRHATGKPVAGTQYAIGWGVSQSGRFLRHFLYQGFNADEQGRRSSTASSIRLAAPGRGSFNHRFGQASRDALQHFNILFPVDMFPFTTVLRPTPRPVRPTVC